LSQGASSFVCQVVSRALDKTVNRSAHEHVADTPSQPRERNLSVNLTRHS